MSLNKFVNVPPEKPFHSNQYAEAARSGQIGSTNSQTFSQRTQIEKSRKAIRQYRESLVARGSQRHHAKLGVIDIMKPVDRTALQVGKRQETNARTPGKPIQSPIQPRQSFNEPSSRGYNPYG